MKLFSFTRSEDDDDRRDSIREAQRIQYEGPDTVDTGDDFKAAEYDAVEAAINDDLSTPDEGTQDAPEPSSK